MKMGSLKTFALSVVAVAVIGSTNARAADLPALQPPPIEDFGGWYLRGDIGMSNQRLKQLEHPLFLTATDFEWLDKGGFDSAPFFGIGIGYAHNSWFRWDLTGEYRGKASFHALDRFDNVGTPNTNDYDGMKSEWLFMLNAYVDLGPGNRSRRLSVRASARAASRSAISRTRTSSPAPADLPRARRRGTWPGRFTRASPTR
jgi:opacity protein-like surface antigen